MRVLWIPRAVILIATQVSVAEAQTVTLADVLRQAESHPEVRVAEAEVRAAEGELLGARTLQYNPEVGFDAGRQTPAESGAPPGSTGSGAAYELSASQTIEIGGKRARRVEAAEARVDAARARLDRARQVAVSRARGAYYLAGVARARVKSTHEGEVVADELRSFASERLQLGAGTQLEYNVAAAGAGRARAERLAAERRYRLARADLAAAIGAPPGADLEPDAETTPPILAPPPADALVQTAMARRGDLAVARAESRAARADVALARALGRPDPTLGASYQREPADNTLLVGVSIPLPFFNRNQGGRAVAEALQNRAGVVEEAAAREVERQARTAHSAYLSASEAAVAFDRDVVDKLAENLDLARESFRAGKISLLDFNLIRRDLVETRLAYLDALAELAEARQALELAAGAVLEPSVPDQGVIR